MISRHNNKGNTLEENRLGWVTASIQAEQQSNVLFMTKETHTVSGYDLHAKDSSYFCILSYLTCSLTEI